MGIPAAFATPSITPPGVMNPFANTGAVPGIAGGASAPPLWNQMPNLPPPPFLNQPTAPSAPMTASGTSLGGLPDLPPPSQVAPGIMGNTVQTAQSVPIASGSPSSILPTEDIPPPHLVAPYVYMQRPQQMPAVPAQPAMQMPPTPPKPPQQPQAPPPPATPPQPKGPTQPLDDDLLTDQMVSSLNQRLNAEDEGQRSDAAMDLYKILERAQAKGSANDPRYKPYIDAFMDKIMSDPSAIVRGAGELILQMGLVPTPSDTLKGKLKDLSGKNSLTGESSLAATLLGQANSGLMAKKAAETKAPEATPTGAPAAPAASPPVADGVGLPGVGNMPTMPPDLKAGLPNTGLPANAGPAPMMTNPGGRLNLLSPQQQTAMPTGLPPQAGQRFNYQEGLST